MKEYWDAYDKNGNRLNQTLVRGDQVPTGMYHLVSEILVRHLDGDFLLMQRDHRKSIFPGHYESSAGGSVLQGETAEEGAIRELLEETGIDHFESLKLINTDVYMDSIFYTYLCITNFDKNQITLQEQETIDYKWISKEEYMEYIESDIAVGPQIDRLKPYIEILKEDAK